jgi:hypothetical protein
MIHVIIDTSPRTLNRPSFVVGANIVNMHDLIGCRSHHFFSFPLFTHASALNCGNLTSAQSSLVVLFNSGLLENKVVIILHFKP